MSQLEIEYDPDPESIQAGEEIESKHSWCGVCFSMIYQPILNGIWYHRGNKKIPDDHIIKQATFMEQLFLDLEAYSKGKSVLMSKRRKCQCYRKWFIFIHRDFEFPFGIYSEHCFGTDGFSLCGDLLHGLYSREGYEPEFPEKQSYNCEKCFSILEKKKFIKIIPPTGKNKNVIYNRIEWLKNNG